MDTTKEKTYKRELSLVCLAFLGYLAITDKVEALEILAFPVFVFTFGAYGMEWASRQTDLVKKSQIDVSRTES